MQIDLSQGYKAEIDFSDWWKLKGRKWFAHVRPRTVYVCSSSKKGTTVYLHRHIMDAPDDMQVDHIDGDGLNNRRSNLRLATSAQNNANALRAANATGYIGVSFREGGRYQARGRKDGIRYSIGMYDTAEEAARAYDEWTLKAYGPFAVLNFPQG